MVGGKLETFQGIFRSGNKATVTLSGGNDAAGFVAGHAATADNVIKCRDKGRGFAVGSCGSSTSDVATDANAGFVVGYAVGSGRIRAYGTGSFAQGYNSSGKIYANGNGSFAQGHTSSGSTSAYNKGCFAQGYSGSGCIVISGDVSDATTVGCFAQGYAKTTSSSVKSIEKGTFAQGFALNESSIDSNEKGSFGQGFGKTYGVVESREIGGFAQGYAIGYKGGSGNKIGRILAYKMGAFAHGFCKSNYPNSSQLFAASEGSFVHGYSIRSIKTASGIGKVLFSSDIDSGTTYSNSRTSNFNTTGLNAMTVGGQYPIHLIGGGTPSSPVTGDIWVNGGYVKMFSRGYVCTVTNNPL